jgi:hypothetical protein
MFHLLIVFPINAAEQEKYNITNVLKKPQHVNVRQFVWRVEQLNAYILQMPCFYNSPRFNATTKPENVPFMEAELGSHVLRMCSIQWQDQEDTRLGGNGGGILSPLQKKVGWEEVLSCLREYYFCMTYISVNQRSFLSF